MNETRKSNGTTSPTPRRADRRAAAVITEYIHELATPARRSAGFRPHTAARPA